MSNRFYTNSIDLISGNKARATEVEANFTSIEVGFDALALEYDATIGAKSIRAGDIYTGSHDFTGANPTVATKPPGNNSTSPASTAYADSAVAVEAAARIAADALKAPLASPTFTGPVTVPSPSNPTDAVNKQYADALAFSAALPSQAGNAGKFVTTNGTVASWADPLPSQTGNAGKFLQTNGTTPSWVSASAGNHEVVVHTGNGNGSTNNRIRRFTTTLTNVGTAITYADSATLGASFTINEDGLYAFHCGESQDSGGSAADFGVSLNSAELTTPISSINIANRLAYAVTVALTGAGGPLPNTVSRVVRLTAGDVVRAHGTGSSGTTNAVFFAIRKVGV